MIERSDPRLKLCGFAKLEGDDFSFIIRRYETTLGRASKTPVDVALGDNMNVSRMHAKIQYNFKLKQFELTVQGKNGVTVNTVLYIPSSPPLPLRSKDHLTIGDKSFYFLLPRLTKKQKGTPKSGSKAAMDEDEDGEDEDEDEDADVKPSPPPPPPLSNSNSAAPLVPPQQFSAKPEPGKPLIPPPPALQPRADGVAPSAAGRGVPPESLLRLEGDDQMVEDVLNTYGHDTETLQNGL